MKKLPFSFLPGRRLLAAFLLVCASTAPLRAIDQNGNGLSDIWELLYGVGAVAPGADPDGDGATNAQEAAMGSNPLDPRSRPALSLTAGAPGSVVAQWQSEAGKLYTVEGTTSLTSGNWVAMGTAMGTGGVVQLTISAGAQPRYYYRLKVQDVDSDGDGLSDWEEIKLGMDPYSAHSDRNDTSDLARVTAGLTASDVITVGLVRGKMREDWPTKGVIAIRRSGGIKPLTVNVTFGGTATKDTDYTTNLSGTQVLIPLGAREAYVELTPINDNVVEGTETIIVTAVAGTGYTIGAANSATATIDDASPLPGAYAAARFLLQAAFGPDQDTTGDDVPENVQQLMSVGFDAWITDQFSRPIGYLQPFVDWAVVNANAMQLYGNYKEHSWWMRAMGSPKLRPDAVTTQVPDPLRQRIAFALDQILVTSDRTDVLGVQQQGMANYYDLMVKHAFGNYRNLLYDVAVHPVMGSYLSHLNNQKANPASNIFPDENFAREIMQLFTIGLWKLNVDGTRQLDGVGQPIQTYTNADITELARVFTGLTYGSASSFPTSNGDFLQPMKMWDAFHDCNAKTLLGGLALPARTPSAGNTGTAGLADVNAAVDNLFNHQNVGPMLARLLIQRLVTSNPSPAYIGRVASAFNNNGSGVRGDMQAVVRTLLMDPEARDPAMMDLPGWGRLREPFLRVVNMARAFNAASTSGFYPLDQFATDHLEDPMNAPSVFNFYLPAYSPSPTFTALGLVAPEFQIINASTAISGPNYFLNALQTNSLHRYGSGTPSYVVKLNTDLELALIVPAAQINLDTPAGPQADSDQLLRRLDLALTGGTLSERQFQIIRESIERIKPPNYTYQWHRARLQTAIYLFVTSAEFNVQR